MSLIERAQAESARLDAENQALNDSISRQERAELAVWISRLLERQVDPDALRLVEGRGHWGSHYDFEAEGLSFHTYRMWEGSFYGHMPHLWWLMPNGKRRLIEVIWNFEKPMWDEGKHTDECEVVQPVRAVTGLVERIRRWFR